MHLSDSAQDKALAELDAIRASPEFAKSPRMFQLLEYLVLGVIEGRSGSLKESVIGIEVFGRESGYDSRLDPVVRTEARRLRSKLLAYYARGGESVLRISIPTGSYVPVFEPVQSAEPPAIAQETAAPFAAGKRTSIRWGAVLLAGALAVGAPLALRLSRANSPDPVPHAATDLYLSESHHLYTDDPASLDHAITGLEEAIRIAPNFAPAHSALAEVHLNRVRFGYERAPEGLTAAHRSADRALTLDHADLAAKIVLARLRGFEEWNWNQEAADLENVIAGSKPDPRGLFSYGALLAAREDFPAAKAAVQKGLLIVPNSQGGRTLMARIHYLERDYPGALQVLQSMPREDPEDIQPDMLTADIHIALGNAAAARHTLELTEHHLFGTPLRAELRFARAYALSGDLSETRLEPAVTVALRTGLAPLAVSRAFCALGRNDDALRWIARAVAQHDPDLMWLRADPAFDSVRADPSFAATLKQIGLN